MIHPVKKPEATRATIEAWCKAAGVTITGPTLVGRRGYYRETMGTQGQGRGVYDDALFLITPTEFHAFNANTDPSTGKPGMATLCPGLWRYRVGIHGLSRPAAQRYTALVQADAVEVTRDGKPGRFRGFFGINIHRGGLRGTSSEGCQTIPPGQWPDFIAAVQRLIGNGTIPYLLTERP